MLRSSAPPAKGGSFTKICTIVPLPSSGPGEPPARGILCPRCGGKAFHVTNTEQLTGGQTRRRKVCRGCGHKVVTVEGTLATLREVLGGGPVATYSNL